MKAIIVLENENDRFPLKLSNEITKLHEWYTDKYTDARAKGNIAEINKVMHPESEKSEIDEKQIKLAEEMRKKLWEIPVLARNPNELNAFIDYFKNPASSFSVDRKNDYAAFLSLFYRNINQLDKQAQTQCLNVADRLEGSMQDDDAIGFQFFDDAQMDNKSQEVFDLMDSLREYDVPSSSLLRFFYYLKNGKETIDPKSYWQLLQFLANQQSAMEVNLRPDQLVFFKKVLQDLRTDLGNYRTKNKIQ